MVQTFLKASSALLACLHHAMYTWHDASRLPFAASRYIMLDDSPKNMSCICLFAQHAAQLILAEVPWIYGKKWLSLWLSLSIRTNTDS
jgi:hypothetical protein